MLKRPKPGEEEEDLLEFQQQFLAGRAAPSASVEKPCTSQQRDVVKMEGLPSNLPSAETQPPVKKSRFKEQQQAKSKFSNSRATGNQQKPAVSSSQALDSVRNEKQKCPVQLDDGDIIDEHEKSTATVLAKIIEKDTRYGNFSVPVKVKLPFPAVPKLDETNKQESEGVTSVKKKSLFAQQFIRDHPEASDTTTGQETFEKQTKGPDSAPHIIDGSGLSATFGHKEASDIHKENVEKLSQLTPEEIIEEQVKLLHMLDSNLVEFLKQRKAKTATKTDEQPIPMDTEDAKNKPSKPDTVKESPVEPTIPVDSRWLNMDRVEHDKLQWMKDLPTPTAGHSKTGSQARFDFQGQLLPPDADIPVNLGLHHHGDEPERAGYTLEEIFTLSRSSNTQQRVLALTTLARVISQAKQGALQDLVQTPVLPSILDAGVIFLLRWSLDDSVEAVMGAAVAAFNALLVNQADEACLDRVFHWYHGYRVASQAPVRHESVGIKLPGESEEKAQETDADVSKRDIILALVTRMNFLHRVYYILTSVRPQAPSVVALLEILTRLARHSAHMAHQVFNHKGLLELVIREFLPMSWTQAPSSGVSDVYGVPVREAMRLILTLCQAGRNMATILLDKFGIQDRIMRYMLADTSGSSPDDINYMMKLEALKVWKICLSYGLTDIVYVDMYPRVIEELRCITDVPALPVQIQLAALIGCLEMAVITAAHSHSKQQAFIHSHDGPSQEVEPSEDRAESSLNWSHVADLIQPIKILLQHTLSHVGNNFQITKCDLTLVQACLNFVTTFYICAQTQTEEGYLLASLNQMEEVFTIIMQNWGAIGLKYMRGQLSVYSNAQQHQSANSEAHASLPEFGNSSLLEENYLPSVRVHSPYGFLVALFRLIYHFNKIHRGLLKLCKEDMSQSICRVAKCPNVWSYLRKVVVPAPYVPSYYNKWEFYFNYYVLKLSTLVLSANSDLDLDRAVLHHLALTVLTWVQHGDEYLVHDLLSTVVFSPHLCSKPSDDPVDVNLASMHVTEPPTTTLHVSSSGDSAGTCRLLCEEACTRLASIRASYLAALSHLQETVLNSRHHFMQSNPESVSCFTGHHGDSLMPRDWMFLPLIDLYNTYSTVGLEVQNVISSSQLDMVRNVLAWVYLLEYNRTARLEQVSITLKISRIMCVFLTGNDMFLDKSVHCYLEGLLNLYCKPSLLDKINFEEEIPGLPSFYDLYTSLLQQYEAVSFGDPLFACYLLIPIQQRHSILYRKAIWTEYTGILRTLSLPLKQLLVPVSELLVPEERDVELLRLYYQSLYGGTLRHGWSPVLYLVAVHHVNRFLYTREPDTQAKLKTAMIQSLSTGPNKVLCHHLLYYKMANLNCEHGMELYQELPAIRQKYLDSVQNIT